METNRAEALIELEKEIGEVRSRLDQVTPDRQLAKGYSDTRNQGQVMGLRNDLYRLEDLLMCMKREPVQLRLA